MDTYMQEDRFWWMAFDYKGQLVNNWNPWCNANVLQCFLLLENDKNKLADAVYSTMVKKDHPIGGMLLEKCMIICNCCMTLREENCLCSRTL